MKRVRFFSFCAAFFLLAGFLAFAFAAESADDDEVQIISPEDQNHQLLKKTCLVCHREGELLFLIIASKKAEALDKAHEKISGVTTARTSIINANPHSETVCLFCHFAPPAEGDKSENLLFRTLEGNPVGRDEIDRLCVMCHPNAVDIHPKVVDSFDKARSDLEKAGLVKEGRSIKCPTCHDMHSKTVGSASVKVEFAEFAKNSIHVFPHSNRAGCLACHPENMKAFGEPVFTGEDPDLRCQRCHPVNHDSVHQAKVASTAKTFPMDFSSFPLGKDKKTNCSSCHDEPCGEKLSPKNPAFLRGGPYSMFTDFCYNCHPKAGPGGLNPHDQVDAAGNIVMTACIFCHTRDANSTVEDPGRLAFRYSPLELCVKCHEPWPHPSGINHITEISDKKKKQLDEYVTRHGVKMPIDTKGRVTCTTCHNPHAKGVVTGQSALGAEEEHSWRVPSFAELCTPCHARYD